MGGEDRDVGAAYQVQGRGRGSESTRNNRKIYSKEVDNVNEFRKWLTEVEESCYLTVERGI